MICCSVLHGAFARLKHCLLSLGLLLCIQALAQTTDSDPLIQARAAIAKQEWSKAEAIIQPIMQSQPKNPFAMYELAQVYENTNRIEAAKQLYLDLTGNPEFIQRQPTLVIRAPYASKMVYILSLAQARLNAIAVKQLDAMPAPPPVVVQVRPAALPTPVPVPPVEVVTPKATATSSPPVASPAPTQQNPDATTPTAVSTAMKNWADAWAKKDLPRYFASYTENFRGNFQTPEAWKKQRLTNISKSESIKLDFKNIEMTTLSSTSVQVIFTQLYQSTLLKETSKKNACFCLKEWEVAHRT